MCKKTICLLSLVLALGLVSRSFGAEVLVSSFEGGLEGWYTDTWTAGTVTVGTTGATAGAQALQVDAPGGWQQCTKVSVKPHLAVLGTKGVKITADATAFAADMTTTWMQVGMVLNCQNNDNNGANNNLGWIDLGLQDLARDGQPHTLTWMVPDDATAKIAGADDSIAWFEFLLISNVDGASVAKFYVDNIKIAYEEATSSVVVGDFEGGLDGWQPGDGMTLSFGATGATAGSQALQVDGPGGWHIDGLLDAKPHRALLGTTGVKITADVTAFAADMTTQWMQVGMVVNAQNNNDAGANNNIGWQDLGSQDLPRDGQPHTLTWELSDTLTAKIAAADDNIWWFELALISNLDGASVTKFYVDNIQVLTPKADTGKSTDVIIGDWEQSMDGWTVAGGADVRYSDTNGVTLGNYSLDIWVPTGAWAAVLQMDLLEPNNADVLAAFRANTEIKADITHLVADWPVDDIPPWNETVFVINTNAGYFYGKRANWQQTNGDRTDSVTWDYSEYLSQIDFDTVTYLQLQIVVNANSPNYTGWVWFYIDNMRLSGAGGALYPQPASGAIDVPVDSKLSWTAGTFATTHHVYFGTDGAKVRNADRDSDPDVVFAEVAQTSFDPNGLAFETQYFWRVDEVNEASPDSPWKGPVWSFTSANFIVVDDFESYNDLDPPDPASHRIFESWSDGFGVATNGALVGNALPPYAEQSVVHSGAQAMPLFYDNSGAALNSETSRAWAEPQDWTVNGFNSLKLFIHGAPSNFAGQLYITVEDSTGISAKVTNPDSSVFTSEEWNEWAISLDAIAASGVNVTAVSKLVIGVEDLPGQPEANGLLDIDDIRVGFQPIGLVAYYALDNNVQDGSGNGHDGTLAGNAALPATYLAGPVGFGQGMLFDGSAGHQNVEVGTFNPSEKTGHLSVALWAKWDGASGQWQGLIGKRDSWNIADMMWHIEVNRDSNTIGFASYGVYPNSGGATLPIGVWTHVAVTFDGTTARFYINGEQTGSGGFSFSEDKGAAVHFGSDDPNGGNPFNGALDEVRIYDVVLSQSEIAQLAGK